MAALALLHFGYVVPVLLALVGVPGGAVEEPLDHSGKADRRRGGVQGLTG